MVVIRKSGPDVTSWAREKVQNVQRAARLAMDDTVELGKNTMEYNIATRGTAKSGKRGRIETGDMLQSVDSRVVGGGDNIVGAFGWLDQNPDYALYQEFGTSNGIEPMLALTDAFEDAQVEFVTRFDKMVD